MKPIAYNLKALMYKANVTQPQFARMVGVSQPAVSQWLRGMKVPSDNSLMRICEVFQVSESDLLSDDAGLYRELTGRNTPLDNSSPRLEYAFTTMEGEQGDRYPVPTDLAREHPRAFFVEVAFDTLDKVVPVGCVALVDPAMEPHSGSVVCVNDTGRKLYRWLAGNSFVALVPESHDPSWKDVMTDRDSIDLVGVVVWFQAAGELR